MWIVSSVPFLMQLLPSEYLFYRIIVSFIHEILRGYHKPLPNGQTNVFVIKGSSKSLLLTFNGHGVTRREC